MYLRTYIHTVLFRSTFLKKSGSKFASYRSRVHRVLKVKKNKEEKGKKKGRKKARKKSARPRTWQQFIKVSFSSAADKARTNWACVNSMDEYIPLDATERNQWFSADFDETSFALIFSCEKIKEMGEAEKWERERKRESRNKRERLLSPKHNRSYSRDADYIKSLRLPNAISNNHADKYLPTILPCQRQRWVNKLTVFFLRLFLEICL